MRDDRCLEAQDLDLGVATKVGIEPGLPPAVVVGREWPRVVESLEGLVDHLQRRAEIGFSPFGRNRGVAGEACHALADLGECLDIRPGSLTGDWVGEEAQGFVAGT